MVTGTLKSQIDGVWNAFWAGGIANPLEVIEQITYLLFLRRLDDLHTLEENKAARRPQASTLVRRRQSIWERRAARLPCILTDERG
jgi:HsdM-like protein